MSHLNPKLICFKLFVVINLFLNDSMMIYAQSQIEQDNTSSLAIETESLNIERQLTEDFENENLIQWDMILVIAIGFTMMCSGAYMMKKRREKVVS